MTSPAAPRLRVAGREVDLTRPLLMGIVEAVPAAGSDGGDRPDPEHRATQAIELARQGADIVDVGGQSGNRGGTEGAAADEITGVLPVVEGIRRDRPDVLVSVDASDSPAVEAALAAGASVINDVSGRLHPEVVDLCAQAGAALVLPRRQLDTTAGRGLPPEATIVDVGSAFSQPPRRLASMLQELDEVTASGRPMLLSLARQGFGDAVTEAWSRRALAGTLATVGHVLARTGGRGCILRIHDVAEVVDYLRVAAVLAGRETIPEDLTLAPHLRREKSAPS